MTTELEALRRVAEAARKWARWTDHRMVDANFDFYSEVSSALEALDALPAPDAEPEGEVVEVVAAVRIVDGGLPWVHHSEQRPDGSWDIGPPGYIATIRARVPLPRVPEVVGEVG